MYTRSCSARILAFAFLVACLTRAGATPLSPESSGAPEGWLGTRCPSVTPAPPSGLDDAFHPLEALTGPFAGLFDTRDVVNPLPVGESAPLWLRLETIAREPGRLPRIEIEPGSAAGPVRPASAQRIAALWNGGEPRRAIEALRDLEDSGAELSLGIDGSAAIHPGQFRNGTDIRLGTRTGARCAALDFDAQSGHVFSVVQWGSTTAESHWTVHLSADHGATWSQTYEFVSNVGLVDVDAVVVDDWLYVGYVVGNAADEFRMRRFDVNDGRSDTVYGYHVAMTALHDSFIEVAVASNADDFDNRIYGLTVTDLDTLRFAWDLATDGTTFTEESPATSNASGGLDAAWANHYPSGSPFLFVSYAGTDGHIHVRARDASTWTDLIVATDAGADKETSISVFSPTVICAYETPTPTGRAVHYRISYDSGQTWNIGYLATPDGTIVTAYGNPSVDLRTGFGSAIIFQAEMGAEDAIYYRVRQGYVSGPWEEQTAFNDHDVFTGLDGALSPLSFEPGSFDHGAVYIANAGIPYFDRPASGSSGVPEAQANSLQLLSPFPNPFRDRAEIRFVLAEPGPVRLQVFDVLGRRVAVLLDGALAAGAHAIPLSGRDLGSAAYYYRLSYGSQELEGRITRIR